MVQHNSLLVMLVQLVERIPMPPTPLKRGKGRPTFYPDRLFLKALVIMILKHLHSPYEFFCVLQQPTQEMQTLRQLLSEQGRFPSRRTWERRLKAIPDHLPAQISCLGCHLVELINPWQKCGRGVAADSTILHAKGGVWHQKHREVGEIPHTSIDTQAGWTKSGWHGWVWGWKLHLITVVADVWIPLAAQLTPANSPDSAEVERLVVGADGVELPSDIRYVLGDRHYNTPLLRAICTLKGWWLVATHYGKYPHTDMGVEVRRIFHKLRSLAIENFNEHFKGIFDGHTPVPTRGLVATRRFALGAVFVYQLALLYRFEHGLDLNIGLKAFLKAA
jgi:hypothetical protein